MSELRSALSTIEFMMIIIALAFVGSCANTCRMSMSLEQMANNTNVEVSDE